MAARTLRDVRTHDQPGVELSSDRLAMVVLPGFGGRVVSLRDRRSGRDWLLQGRPPSRDVTRTDAVYDAGVAWGWDECLPTVAPCPDPRVPGRLLRDHGDVWGRPTQAESNAACLRLTFKIGDSAGDRQSYTFRRIMNVDDRTVRVDYELDNDGSVALPVLWSMHPLVALEPGSRFHLPGVTELVATFAAGESVAGLVQDDRGQRVAWPAAVLPSGAKHHLDLVPGPGAREAVKLYAGPLAVGAAAVSTPDGAWLGYRWDLATAPFMGIWISNGGWPAPGAGIRQHAVEPTTAPADSLAAATDQGRALTLMPGERRSWWVTLDVGSPTESLGDYLGIDHRSLYPATDAPPGGREAWAADPPWSRCSEAPPSHALRLRHRGTRSHPGAATQDQGRDRTPWPTLKD